MRPSPRLNSSLLADRGCRLAGVPIPICPPPPGQTAAATDAPPPASVAAFSSVLISEPARFVLSLIAAHQGRPDSAILAELIGAAGEAIGLSPLLSGADAEDLADVPDFARRAANRFRDRR